MIFPSRLRCGLADFFRCSEVEISADVNRSIGKDIQKTAQQFHGIPLPIDDPESERFPVQFSQSFPQRQTVFFQPLVAPGGGIDDHEMFGKLSRNIDEFDPAVRAVQVSFPANRGIVFAPGSATVCLTEVSFPANRGIVFVRLMGFEHIGI